MIVVRVLPSYVQPPGSPGFTAFRTLPFTVTETGGQFAGSRNS